MKKLTLSIFIAFLFSALSSYSSIIAYWSFDDSTAKDFSGNGYHGTMRNNPKPVPGVNGKGTAMSFIGKDYYVPVSGNKGIIGSYIDIPNVNLSIYSSYTISLWVLDSSMTTVGGEAYIMLGSHTNAWNGIGRFQETIYNPTYYLFSSAGNYVYTGLSRYIFDLANLYKWVHYTLVYNNGVLKTYINGTLAYTQSGCTNPLISGNSALAGHYWTYSGEYRQSARFTGVLDEVMIFNEALSDSAILELYHPLPTIKSQINDCNKRIYKVESFDNIDSINIVNSKNMKFNFSSNAPTKSTIITARITDISINGYYTIIIKTNKGQELLIKDSIIFEKYPTLAAPLQDGFVTIDSVHLNGLKIKSLLIKNPTLYEAIINNAYFLNNTEYSLVQSQIPIVIPAGGAKEVLVAFNPTNLGAIIDTLIFPLSCGELEIPFKSICLAKEYAIHTECDAISIGKTISAKFIDLSPNPADDIIGVKVKLFKTQANAEFEIINNFGEKLTAKLISKSISGGELEAQIDISNLSSGVYQIALKGEYNTAKAFVVAK